MRVTLKVESETPDEALELLYKYLAEDREFFAEARPERVYAPAEPGTLAVEVLVAILVTVSAVNAVQSVVDAAKSTKRLAEKLHGFAAEHRGHGVRAVTVSGEEGETSAVTAQDGTAEAEGAVRRAIQETGASEEQHGTEAP